MSKEERHLQTKIRMFEDILLRTKNPTGIFWRFASEYQPVSNFR